ncbi:hypothetical protein HD554DRAFT_301681 [Boletus coccyginus]|nr:hypothetical protein HD554DRAFT_301681 [Boletus coccyginus]
MDSDSPPHDPLSEPEMLEPPDSKSEISSPPASELAISPSTTSELEVSSLPTPPPDNPWLVITRVRAQNITSGLKRIPAGFYVLIQFNGSQRRTQNKSIRLNDSGLEWEDKILLPSNVYDKVRFMVYASFELEPMLGNGEALYTSERHVGELVGGTHLITFPATPDPSLLITLGRWYSNRLVVAGGNDSNLDSEEPSVLVRETELGQEALLRYYNEYQREDLKNATQHFEDALRHCPSKHQCRAAVLVNLAKAKFISYQIDPTSANLDESILPYREALDLRRPGHLDRLATLLQLAQTLLSRYEKQGCDESVADQITKLMSECLDCPEDSHERRAADLVLETLERCTVVNSGNLVELDKLAQKLKKSALVLPDNYFDRPQRLINLSTTLRKCYEKYGKLGDLECLLEINKQASQLLPAHHPDRLPGLRALDAALWRPSEIRGDLSYLREVIVTSEDALRLIPEGHPERRYWITNSASCLSEMSERLGDKAFEARKYDEAIAQYSQAIVLRSTPS